MPNQAHFTGLTVYSAMSLATGRQNIGVEGKAGFDLVAQIASGRCLLVGEGNLSFTKSLLNFQKVSPSKLVATTFERPSSLSDEVLGNAKYLYDRGAIVLHGVNARRLDVTLKAHKFSTIIFQFPHTGRRNPVEGKNPNYVLVRDFLNSAQRHLLRSGVVCISAVDSPHYQGAFQFEKAAASAGCHPPSAYKFEPKHYKGYVHSMTNEASSALGGHSNFKTWLFKPKWNRQNGRNS